VGVGFVLQIYGVRTHGEATKARAQSAMVAAHTNQPYASAKHFSR
jgi:hypothetical protein